MSVGKEKINVLSLFDGISCGQIALERAGIEVENYFASEIEPSPIKVTQTNYPNTKQLGSVLNVKGDELPMIDLLIGGSPCQGFSFAGKQLNFDDPRSKLFFEYVRLKNELNPKYFLLENVKMKKEYQDIISSYLGVEPIMINSNLVSAQKRARYYWTNIPVKGLPNDRGVLLKDVTEDGLQSLGLAQRGRYDENGKVIQKYELNGTEKSNAMTTVSKDTLLFIPVDKHSSNSGLVCLGGVMKPTHKLWLNNGKLLQRNFSQGNRVYSSDGKSATLNANSGGIGGKTGLYEIEGVIRKLTRLECERLQTVPDGYTNSISDTQAIKALGNGWTVDVISFIFSFLRGENFLNSFSHESSIEAQK
ncbi:MAG TPA: DNA (cytosine-5-)-methyltransferase [Candidatus Glassbacteria bacterium]|nr:DNA (cytosine-5-)-methyltransferase [Candidatus Glassbacteria bacterium]